ncbi:TPA: hypothetical protein QDA84_000457 [Burkholderia vietnamiensis]|nr:hypothetical protein [Burkholderia vietnamiensis]
MTNEELAKQLVMVRAELLAQNALLKALIQTHFAPDILREAFMDISEKSVSIALASSSTDGSIEAFEFFRDKWLEWLPLPQQSDRQSPPTT